MSAGKVLIIGPRFHYFNASIERAFRSLDYLTEVLAYDNPVHPYTLVNKVRYKLTGDKLKMKRRSRQAFQVEAQAAFAKACPDVVFVMNGDMLLPSTIEGWRKQGAKVALWFFDSMTHIPLCEDNIPAVDAVFCYEQTDIPLIKERYGVTAHFLPQAVDLMLYHPLAAESASSTPQSVADPKLFDIVFAGDIFHSRRRREIIQALVSHYPQLRIRVWGDYKPWYKNPLRWLLRERRDVYQNRNTTGQQLNLDYNHSHLVLNIHIEQQKDGANPKVYEICASGAYQICNANPYLEQLFPHGEVGLYHSLDELFALVDHALSHDMSTKALAAHRIVVSQHTFQHRMQYVIEQL